MRGAPAGIPERYEVHRKLGAGGMGGVWLVEDRELERTVALKILHEALIETPTVKERFEREARILGTIRSPHLVEVYDLRVDALPMYLTMELVEGVDLADRVAEGRPFPLPEVARLAREVAGALARLHARGVLHRDLKPANVMQRRQDGSFVVMDLGLALVHAETRFTRTGEFVGTPLYLPPEVLRDDGWCEAGDQYQLACILQEAVSGRVHLDARNSEELMKMLLAGRRPPLPADLPGDLAVAIQRALEPDPADRFPDVTSFAEAVEEAVAVAEGRRSGVRDAVSSLSASSVPAAAPPGPRPAGVGARALIAGLLALACGVAGWWWSGSAPAAPSGGSAPPSRAGEPGAGGGEEPPRDGSVAQERLRLEAAARVELEDAKLWSLGPDGEVFREPPSTDPSGELQPLLDPDPDRVGPALAELSALRALARGLGAGPPPSPPLATRLEELDARYFEELHLQPLAAFRHGPTGPGEAPIPWSSDWSGLRDLPRELLPPTTGGWVRAVVLSRAALEERLEHCEESFREDAELGDMGVGPLVRAMSFSRASSFMLDAPRGRAQLSRYLAPVSEAARRMVLATARAMRDSPLAQRPDRRAALAYLVAREVSYQPFAFLVELPGDLLLGREASSPEEWALVAASLHAREKNHRRSLDLDDTDRRRLPRALAQVEGVPGDGRGGRLLRDLAWKLLGQALARRQDTAALHALDRRVARDLDGFVAPRNESDYLRDLLVYLVGRRDTARIFSGPDREDLRARARRLADRLEESDPDDAAELRRDAARLP